MAEPRDDLPAYLSGYDACHLSEAIEGVVPRRQNSPRVLPHGLFAEQLNGTSFTVPRAHNRRTWMYRVRPSVIHGEQRLLPAGAFGLNYLEGEVDPNLIGWRPHPFPDGAGTDFVDGLFTLAGAGDPAVERGLAIHLYAANASMGDRSFCNADGDLAIFPDTGTLHVRTELGWLHVAPGEMAIIPRGLLFSVGSPDPQIRGFVLEVYARHFELPDRGVIGANGLADARHFHAPTASYEDRAVGDGFKLITKMGGRLWEADRSHSPFDVVGWHGDYVPHVYDLADFNGMNTVTFDHPDPSIFTVLSAPLDQPGENLADIVVFPNPRWEVAKGTFRPPYYHRNPAMEFNFIITGSSHDDRVFTRGGHFVTPPFAAHGVASGTFDRAVDMDDAEADRPMLVGSDNLWMQFESTLPLRFAPAAMTAAHREPNFRSFASGVKTRFDPNRR